MNAKLFFSNLIISFIGVLSLLLVFIKPFDAEIKYLFVGVLFAIVLASTVATVIHMLLKKKWIFWIGFTFVVALFVWIFRYELFGGYMEFYNVIMDRYSSYFEMEMYFALPTAKYVVKANMTLMLYFSIVVVSCLYSIMIYRKKMLFVPILVNILLMAVPIIINNNPAYPAVLLNVVFCIQVFVINVASVRVKKDEDAMASVQNTSLFTGAIIFILTGAVMFLVPGKGYKKAEMFNKVENYVVSVAEKIGDKIASVMGGNNGFGIELGAEAYIDNGELGQVDSIVFDNVEMLQVMVPTYGNKVYLKQFIGEKYSNNQWWEPNDSDFNRSLANNMGDLRPQQMAAMKLIYMQLRTDYEYDNYLMSIKYTGLSHERQLMPLYSYTGNVEGFKGESYYHYIPDYESFRYFDVTNEELLELFKDDDYISLKEEWWYIDNRYNKYVNNHYLDVNTECEKQFREVLKGQDVLSPEGVFRTAEYVRQHLAKRCTYTRSPGVVPKGEEFVDYFYNDSKEGYCTYFATTAAMMLRSVGIPARYVTGFAFEPGINIISTISMDGIKYSTVSVEDSKAHAWVEFFVEGWGWVPLDVTPGTFEIIDYEEETTAPEEPETTTAEKEEETTTSPDKETTEDDSREETTTEAKKVSTQKFHLSKTFIRVMLYIVGVAGIIGAIWLVIYVRYTLIRNKRAYYYEEGKKNNLNKCMLMNYNEFERILGFIGIRRGEYSTYEEFGKMIMDNCSHLEESEIAVVMQMYEKAIFSSDVILLEELEKIEEVLGLLRDKVYNDVNFVKKFAFKYLYII